MKKHPLDDFFAERLSGNEIAPSQRARDLFQERLAEREKKAAPFLGIRPRSWYYYGAAASVVLLMTIGYLQYGSDQKQTAVVAEVQSQKPSIKNTAPAPDLTPEIAEVAPQKISPANVSPLPAEINRKVAPKQADVKPERTAKQNPVPLKTPEVNVDFKDQLALNTETPVENVKAPEVQTTAAIPSPVLSTETIVLITSLAREEKMNLPDHKPTMKVADNVAFAAGDQEEKSVFLRVFGEIRNLKHGEKVDFGKLGLKRPDQEAREEGFIASETRQIREGWQWIKGKINNN